MAGDDIERIRDALRAVIDPENGINIVDLGLVYGIKRDDDRFTITMTLTSPACPMGEMILEDIEDILGQTLPAGCDFVIDVVWSPPWEPSLMSDAARRQFGW